MKTCFFCKNDTVIHTLTTYMVDLKDCIIIVKNVIVFLGILQWFADKGF